MQYRFVFWIYWLGLAMCSAQTLREKAVTLFEQEKYTQAKPLFEQWLKESPNNLFALEHLGDIEGYAHHWDECLAYYERLVQLKPNEANYHYKCGGALGMKAKDGGKWVAIRLIGRMKDCFLKTLELNPKHIEARWALIEYYLQLPGLFGGSERKAQLYADQLLPISPVDHYLAKGHIDEYFERFTEAEKHYRKAVEVGGSKTTYERLAYLYRYKLHQPDRAREVLAAYARKQGS